MGQQIPDDLPQGIIHGDLFPDNVLGRAGGVEAILDFEEGCIHTLAFDLAMTYVGFGWKDGKPDASLWQALRAGYESVRPLTTAEVAAMPLLHRYATLAIAAWRYWQFVLNIEDSPHAERYLEMTARLDEPLPF